MTEKVLVIDDDAILRDLLTLLLGAEGHDIITADSGDLALSLLAGTEPADRPTVLLTDLRMPGVSHSALAVRLRLVCPPSTLLIAMSASEPTEDEVAGFDAFVRKPFSIAEFDAAIDRARSSAAELASDGARPPAVAAASLASEELDRDSPPNRVLNESIYQKLFSVMGPTELPPLYTLFLDDALTRGRRMIAAAAENDAATFTREAHAVKGGCGMLGATELYSLARRMETGGLACSSLLDDFRPALERLRRILDKRITIDVYRPTRLPQ